MKILVICTTVYDLPPKGYSGLEWLVSEWAKYFRDAGHQVSVVCPGESNLGEGIEIISTGLREPEGAAYLKYKNKLESGELSLDDSLQYFQRGMELINFCSTKLEGAEKKLKIIMEGEKGDFRLEDSE